MDFSHLSFNSLSLKAIKTGKAIGFKSLRLNSSDVTQAIQKCEMSTSVSKTLIRHYPATFVKKINMLRLSH